MIIIDTAKKTIGFLGVVRRYIQFRVNKIRQLTIMILPIGVN